MVDLLGFDYTRLKTTRSKAEVLAAIESADYALTVSSGISAVCALVSRWKWVLAVRDLYGEFPLVQPSGQEGRFHFTILPQEEGLNC